MTCLVCSAAAEHRPICRACWKLAPKSYKVAALRAERTGIPAAAYHLAIAEVVRLKLTRATGGPEAAPMRVSRPRRS